jgi:hypothetical protein
VVQARLGQKAQDLSEKTTKAKKDWEHGTSGSDCLVSMRSQVETRVLPIRIKEQDKEEEEEEE